MKGVWAAAVLVLAGCSALKPPATGAFLDPTLGSLVPSDTVLMVDTRVELLVDTPVYQKYLAGKIPAIEQYVKATGVDAADKKLWNVLFVSNGKRGILLARGKFSEPLMEPDVSKYGGRRLDYKGLTMFGEEDQAVLVVNSSTLAMGSGDALRALVEERNSIKQPPLGLVALMKDIPRGAQVWGVYGGGNPGRGAELGLAGNLANLNRVVRMVGSGSFYFDLNKGVNGVVTGNAAGPAQAQELRDSLEGLKALVKMSAPKNQAAVEAVSVTLQDQRVQVSVNAPAELLNLFVK